LTRFSITSRSRNHRGLIGRQTFESQFVNQVAAAYKINPTSTLHFSPTPFDTRKPRDNIEMTMIDKNGLDGASLEMIITTLEKDKPSTFF